MKKFFAVLAVLLMVSAASAVSLEIIFGTGVTHFKPAISARSGAPSVGVKYYFTNDGDDNSSTNIASAFVVSEATSSGTIVYEEYSKSGDCDFYAIIDSTPVISTSLNGQAIVSGQKMKWAVAPKSAAATVCRISFDLNVLSI